MQEATGQLQETAAESAKRVEDATELSETAIRRILRDQKNHEAQGTYFTTHSRTYKVPKRVTDICAFPKKCVIRDTIHELYVQHRTPPTIHNPLPKFRDSITFKLDKGTLWKAVKDLQLLRKTTNKRLVHTEKHDIRCIPVTHLTALANNTAAVYGMIQQQLYWT
jgi:hypothetical protein